MKVLYIDRNGNFDGWLKIQKNDFVTVAGNRFDVRYFDFDLPCDDQFVGIDVVLEIGGVFATSEMIECGARNKVKLWQVLGTGLDHVDLELFKKLQIPLANTPGQFSSSALAEHALFMILYFEKHYPETQRSIREKLSCEPISGELGDKTLGLVGFGASGRELARRASCLGMRLIATDVQNVDEATLKELGVEKFGNSAVFDQLLAESDYVSIHTPLNADTKHMIGAREFGLMKPETVIINVARGEIIDEQALIDALNQRRIRGAGLDTFSREPVDPDHPLVKMDNVLATPHTAGVTTGTSRRRMTAAVENLHRVERGESPLFLV